MNRKSNRLWYSFIGRKTIVTVLCQQRLRELRRKSKIENWNRFSIFVFGRRINQSCPLQVTKVPTGSWWRGCLATFPTPYRPWRNVGIPSFSWNVWRVFCCCEFIVVMASSKILDLSREGKKLRLRIAASDLSVSRLSRAFQASQCICSSWFFSVPTSTCDQNSQHGKERDWFAWQCWNSSGLDKEETQLTKLFRHACHQLIYHNWPYILSPFFDPMWVQPWIIIHQTLI